MTKNEKQQVYSKLQDKKLQVAAHTIGIDHPDLVRLLNKRDRKEILRRNYFVGQDDFMDELVDEGRARRGTMSPEGAIWYQLTLEGIRWVERQLVCIHFLMSMDYLLVLSKGEEKRRNKGEQYED